MKVYPSAGYQFVGLAGGFGQTVFRDAFHDKLVGGLDGNPVSGRNIERFDVGAGAQNNAELFSFIHQWNKRAFFRRDIIVLPGQAMAADGPGLPVEGAGTG